MRRCPLCGARFARFAHGGAAGWRQACPACGSLPRHRLLWLYLERHTDLLTSPKRVLHFAPEAGMRERLRRTSGLDYVTADLEPGRADLALDIAATGLPGQSFDVILCVHVLEHVADDRAALRELHRLLRPDGWAIVQVPIQRATTDEDPAVTSPEERERRFGQADHVRKYGRDFLDRLREAGFRVNVVAMRDRLSPLTRWRCGLSYADAATNAAPEAWEIYRAELPS